MGLKGIPDDERHAAALPLGGVVEPIVEGLREFEGEHRSTQHIGRHTEIVGTQEIDVNTNHSRRRLHSRSVEQNDLGELAKLIKRQREAVSPKMSQAELGRLIGVDQRSVSNIENGVVRSIAPDVANKLPGAIPLTMADLVRALGYDLPAARSEISESMTSALETAPEEVLEAVQLLLDGWQAQQRVRARREE